MRRARLTMALLALLVVAGPARAQMGPPLPDKDLPASSAGGRLVYDPELLSAGDGLNPISVLDSVSRAVPGTGGAQGAGLSTMMNVMILLTVIALAPSIVLMTTCFVRIIVVLSLLKQAIGTQSLPPPQVILALALFMTMLVMSPTIGRIQDEAITPYRQGEITDYETLWDRAKAPVHDFMLAQIQATGNWSSLYMILNYRGVDTSRPEQIRPADLDMVTLVPAFMLSELKTAFLMGVRVYLPFLVIDMVISTMLISMSMMMLPPILISLPFKLLLFVLADGWQLVVGGLMTSFVTAGHPGAGHPGVSLAPEILQRAGSALASVLPLAGW